MKNTKHLKIGIYTVSVAAIAVVIAVLINMMVSFIPNQYTHFDTSGLDLHEISEDTEKIVSSIESDVVLHLIVEEGKQDLYVTNLLNRYASLNSNISVVEVDPILHPSFDTPCGQSYNLGEYEENTVIVSGPARDKVVPYNEIFQTEYSEEEMYYYYYYGVEPVGTTSFHGEAKLTGAVEYVSGDDPLVVYTLSGHGETALGTNLSKYITDDNYTVSSLSLISTKNVPRDASCVIINNPISDITDEELSALADYIKAGGNVILVTGHIANVTLTNLNSLGEIFGIIPQSGLVVESNENNCIPGYPYFLIPNVSAHAITEPMSNMYALMHNAHGLSFVQDMQGISQSAILTTSSTAFITSGETVDKADAISEGQTCIGVISELESEADGGAFVWYSSPGITDDLMDSNIAGGNSTLFLSTLAYVCDKDDSASIAAKSMAMDTLVITEGASNTWSIMIIAVIPLAILVPGFVYWLFRRKK